MHLRQNKLKVNECGLEVIAQPYFHKQVGRAKKKRKKTQDEIASQYKVMKKITSCQKDYKPRSCENEGIGSSNGVPRQKS